VVTGDENSDNSKFSCN